MLAARQKAIYLAKTGLSISDIAFQTKVQKAKVSLWLKEAHVYPHNLVNMPTQSKPQNDTEKEHKSKLKIPLKLNNIAIGIFCISTTIFLATEASKILGSVPLAVLLEVGALMLATTRFSGHLELLKKVLLLGMAALNISILCMGNFVSGSQSLHEAKQNQSLASQIESTLAIKRQELQSLIESKYIGRSAKVSQEISQLEIQKQALMKSLPTATSESLYLVVLTALTRAFLVVVNLLMAKYISILRFQKNNFKNNFS